MKLIKRTASIWFLFWCLFIFTVVMIAILPFIIIITSLVKGKTGHNAAFIFLRIWGWMVSIFCFFPVSIKKRNIYKRGRPYIFVSNHNSYLDSVAIVIAIPQPFKPLGKIEMAKVPIFGMIYRRLVVMIDRKSNDSRKQCEGDLRDALLKGQSIFIFPEGTMNRGNKSLADFYDGAFRLAIETQTPIAPMVILNARKLFPRDKPLRLKPGTINCVFGTAIEVGGLKPEDLPQLKQKVRQQMMGMMAENES